MRTIPEVAEDIKSILNNIERTEECNGETLVDINELVDEILTINCYKDKPMTNADCIRSMSDLELSNFIKSVHNDGTCREYALTHGQDFTDMFGNKAVMQWLQSEVKGSE